MSEPALTAFTLERAAAAAAADLAAQLGGGDARAILFFCSHEHDGAALSGLLRERFPGAEVIGCTTAGAFVTDQGAEAGVSALRLPPDKVGACASALARFNDGGSARRSAERSPQTPVNGGVEEGIRAAGERLAAALGKPLEALDPAHHVGVMLVEGLKGNEERANAALGGVAPLLSFVGGSAGDNGVFAQTRVFRNGEASDDGAALLLVEMRVPFTILKTCSFEPTAHRFTVTRADVPSRTVYELDHRPVLDVYAAAVGVAPAALDASVFMKHPCGMMLDGDPWIRSPQRALPDGGLKFYCQIEEGMTVHLMRSTDLVADTHAAVRRVAGTLGAPIAGALLFNCILRRLQLDAEHTHEAFRSAFAGMAAAGFHTYGESWLGHINQTCTGIVFG